MASLPAESSSFMAGATGLARHGSLLYAAVNLGVWLAAVMGGTAHGGSPTAILYSCALFAICSSPLLLMRRLNDRHVILGIFMVNYFLFVGALDLSHLLFGSDHPLPQESSLSSADLAVLCGAALTLCGYLAGLRIGIPASTQREPREWPDSSVLAIGLTLFVSGTSAMLYLVLVVSPEKDILATEHGLAALGPGITFLVMLGHLVQPLGLLMLAYGYARARGPFWLALIVSVVTVQVITGFLADIKMLALTGFALVIIVRTLVDNRLPRSWLVSGIAFLVLTFPLFQAYRTEIEGARGLNRLQAMQNIGKVLDIVVSSRDKVSEGPSRAQNFLERSSSKEDLDLLFAHVGNDVAFLNGRSLVAIPMAFVPRLLAPDKEDLSAGLLFTRRVLKSDSLTYISITHLGEIYWNFGWPGLVAGCLLAGFMLGYMGGRFNLEQGPTLTRVLLLLATVQPLCMGYGGTMSTSYVVWLRSVAAVILLDWLFARASGRSITLKIVEGLGPAVTDPGRLLPSGGPRFPNLMR
jgi:hypothetical protein